MKIGFLHSDGPYLGIVFGAFAPASDKRKAGTRRHLGINGLYRKSKRRAAARKNYGARLRRHRGLRAGFFAFFPDRLRLPRGRLDNAFRRLDLLLRVVRDHEWRPIRRKASWA